MINDLINLSNMMCYFNYLYIYFFLSPYLFVYLFSLFSFVFVEVATGDLLDLECGVKDHSGKDGTHPAQNLSTENNNTVWVGTHTQTHTHTHTNVTNIRQYV